LHAGRIIIAKVLRHADDVRGGDSMAKGMGMRKEKKKPKKSKAK
jgi:hypothetical protein